MKSIRYSRQIPIFGEDSLGKLFKSRVFLVGLDPLGSEVIKNILLQGVQRVDIYDLGFQNNMDVCSGIIFSPSDIGQKRTCQTTLKKLSQFNPDSSISVIEDIESIDLCVYDVVVVSNCFCTKTFLEIVKKCNKLPSTHLVECQSLGVCGRVLSFPGEFPFSEEYGFGKDLHDLNPGVQIDRKLQKPLHHLFCGVFDFYNQNERFPVATEAQDYESFCKIVEGFNIDKDVVKRFFLSQDVSLPPLITAMGGIVSFQVLCLLLSKKIQWSYFYFEAFNLITDIKLLEKNRLEFLKISDRKYDMYSGVTALFGKVFQDKIFSLKAFLPGMGATGCESLKLLTQLGVKDIVITDFDHIELSNLSRQFLFRDKDIKGSKSEVAAKAICEYREDNSMKITAYKERVPNEQLFPDSFYKSRDAVICGIDSVVGRNVVFTSCNFNKVIMIDSGIGGYQGNLSVHHPYVSSTMKHKETTKKNDNISCSRRQNPTKPIHILQFIYEDVFKDMFENQVLRFNTGMETKLKYIVDTPEECITSAVMLFDEFFKVDLSENEDILIFLKSCSILFSRVYGIEKEVDIIKLFEKFDKEDIDQNRMKKLHTVQKNDENRIIQRILIEKDDPIHLDFIISACKLRKKQFQLVFKDVKFDMTYVQTKIGGIVPTMMCVCALTQGLVGLEFLLSMNKKFAAERGEDPVMYGGFYRSYSFNLEKLHFSTPWPEDDGRWMVEVQSEECKSINDIIKKLEVRKTVETVLIGDSNIFIFDDEENEEEEKDLTIIELLGRVVETKEKKYFILTFCFSKGVRVIKYML